MREPVLAAGRSPAAPVSPPLCSAGLSVAPELLMDRKKALLIVNRKARQRRADELGKGLACLREGGIDVIEVIPKHAGEMARIVSAHHGAVDLIILGGGDGTVNAALEALLACGVPVGLLPMGTANDFARTLDLPDSPSEACQVIAAGRTAHVDVAVVNDKHFVNVASMGLGERVAARLSGPMKRRWGVLGYALAAVYALRGAREFEAEIVCDGRDERLRSWHIAVGNGRFYGGGLVVAEDAAIDDARLDLYSLEPRGRWAMLRLLPALWTGRHHKLEFVRCLSGREIEIRTPGRRRHVNTDGELTSRTPARFIVKPRALEVFVPPGAQPAGLTQGQEHAAKD